MESADHKKLKLLEAIESDCSLSQRRLAQKLDCSLGTVNSLIRQSIQKGYLKNSSYGNKKITYRTTAKGDKRKSELALQYIQHSLNHYKNVRFKIHKWVEKLAASNVRNIAIYGANELAEISYSIFKEYRLEVVAIIDNGREGERIAELTVQNSNFLRNNYFDAIILTLIGDHRKLIEQLRAYGLSSSLKIYSVQSAFL